MACALQLGESLILSWSIVTEYAAIQSTDDGKEPAQMNLVPLEYEPYNHFNVTYLHATCFRFPGCRHASAVAQSFTRESTSPAPENDRCGGWLTEQSAMERCVLPWFL